MSPSLRAKHRLGRTASSHSATLSQLPCLRVKKELEFLGNASRLGRRERDVQRGFGVGVQVLEHYANHLGIRIGDVDKPLHLVSEVDRCASLADLDVQPASGSM